MEESWMPLLLSFGNPLLDMTVVLKDRSLHKKFKLPEDGQLEISSDQHQIFDIVNERDDVCFTAGGCALNTLRVFTWVLGERNKAVFVGGIGKDERAEKLKSILNGCGVTMNFVYVDGKPTGTCVALVLGAERCLCADIGAAAICEPKHIFVDDSFQFVHPLNSASVIYLEGYFITHSFDVALRVARHCSENDKPFVFNLCGSYVCESNSKELTQLLPYVDILFGFSEEYKTLENFVNIPDLCEKYIKNKKNIVHDLSIMFSCLSGNETPVKKEEIILDEKWGNGELDESLHITNDYPHQNNSDTNEPKSPEEQTSPWSAIRHNKLVIVTQGSYPLLYTKEKRVYEQEIPPLLPMNIVDTTGAGDSFVGGFLAAAAKGKSLEVCLECGVWSAQQILQEKGCTIPKKRAIFL